MNSTVASSMRVAIKSIDKIPKFKLAYLLKALNQVQ
jgi:hypothetical protein